MSDQPSLIDSKESIQKIAHIESNLIDQNDAMWVNICHQLTEQQIRRLKQMNMNLLKLLDLKNK